MKTIYKYPLKIDNFQILQIPLGATFLCVKLQETYPVLYAMVDTDNALVPVRIFLVGTGRDATWLYPENYLGTVIMHEFVWHFFSNGEFSK